MIFNASNSSSQKHISHQCASQVKFPQLTWVPSPNHWVHPTVRCRHHRHHRHRLQIEMFETRKWLAVQIGYNWVSKKEHGVQHQCSITLIWGSKLYKTCIYTRVCVLQKQICRTFDAGPERGRARDPKPWDSMSWTKQMEIHKEIRQRPPLKKNNTCRISVCHHLLAFHAILPPTNTFIRKRPIIASALGRVIPKIRLGSPGCNRSLGVLVWNCCNIGLVRKVNGLKSSSCYSYS